MPLCCALAGPTRVLGPALSHHHLLAQVLPISLLPPSLLPATCPSFPPNTLIADRAAEERL